MHILIRFGIVFQLLCAGVLTAAPALSSQTNPHSVEITVSPEQVFPGGSVTVTIHMSTVLDDTREVLDVSVPNGMEVVGSPTCTGACTRAGMTPGTNDLTADFNVGFYAPNPQRVGTLTLTAVVSMDAVPGSSLVIAAYLGSPEASDSVAITVQATPEATAPEAMLYFDVSPKGAVVGPGESFMVFAYAYAYVPQEGPIRTPALDVTATLPEGLALDPGSECIDLQDPYARSPTPLCSISTSSGESGKTVVSISLPSNRPSSEGSVGVLLRLNNMGLHFQEVETITFTLEEPSGTLDITNPFTSMDVFAVESLEAMGADTSQGSMNVLVISEENSCTASHLQGSKLSLTEWRGGSILSTVETKTVGDLGGLPELADRCPLLVTFRNVPPLSLYSLGREFPFCRTCILSTVPWTENSIPIITDNLNDYP